jgi:aromatic-L-amino-acid decarboxylase
VSTFREDGAAALDWVAHYLENVSDYPVLARVEPGAIRTALPSSPPEEPEPFAAVLRDLDEILMPGITHWQSPRFFAYFATTAAEPGILAELLIAGLNQVGILWRASPALQELEEVTLDWLRQLLGLPEPLHGHIEDTASSGLITVLAAARAARPERRVVVCSEHTHSATAKAARLLELDVRSAPVDAAFSLRPESLDLTDACAVVATVGTTSSAAVDPVAAIADRAGAEGVWLHVDAAYAGAAAVCPELRHHFAGWERADSIGVNPHKWLFTPMDCSVLFCRRPDDLRRAFSLVPEFLRVSEDVVSLSEYASPLGRRFRALKLWATLRCFGRDGLQAIIREHVRLAELFARWVEDEPGWELCATRHFSLVCFRKVGSDEESSEIENQAILRRVNDSGEIFLSHTKLDGRFVLRLAIGNARTTEADVALAWDVLRREAAG